MKNAILFLLLGFSLVSMASASYPSRADWRDRQYRQIQDGIQLGLISLREERILFNQQAEIEEYTYYAMRRGINAYERSRIDWMRRDAAFLISEYLENFEYRYRTYPNSGYCEMPRRPYSKPHARHGQHYDSYHNNNGYYGNGARSNRSKKSRGSRGFQGDKKIEGNIKENRSNSPTNSKAKVQLDKLR